MGQFSWLDCKDDTQILDDVYADVYVLVPKEFGGGHIKETFYDGYGHFGGHDIYDLVAEWNRRHLTHRMLKDCSIEDWNPRDLKYYIYGLRDQLHKAEMLMDYRDGMSDSKMIEKHGKDFKREIGIYIACYNDQNFMLPYPIKITHDANAIYENCIPSKSDPNQGWKVDDVDDYC